MTFIFKKPKLKVSLNQNCHSGRDPVISLLNPISRNEMRLSIV